MDESKYGKRYNRQKIIEVYKSGKTVDEIAAMAKCHRSTIYNHLKAAKVEMRDDRLVLPGRPRQRVCGSGEHSMEEGDENVRIDSNGNRHCKACEARRARKRIFDRALNEFLEEQNGLLDS